MGDGRAPRLPGGLPSAALAGALEERGALMGRSIIPEAMLSEMHAMVGEQLHEQAGSSHKDIRLEL